jgi:hypothetical protein
MRSKSDNKYRNRPHGPNLARDKLGFLLPQEYTLTLCHLVDVAAIWNLRGTVTTVDLEVSRMICASLRNYEFMVGEK